MKESRRSPEAENTNMEHPITNDTTMRGEPVQSTDIRQSRAACLAAIRQSRLPKRYKEKLLFDLETIFQISVPGISRIVLFGSCARNELRAGSDLDLLILTLRPVPRELRGELCGILSEEKNIRTKYIENRPPKNNILADNIDKEALEWIEALRRQK